MSLENPTYVEDLNENWPVGATDQLHEGDDHIRGLKRSLVNTFPGMVGRAWRTVARSASAPLGVNDNMTLQNCAAVTLTPDSASVLGNGWMCLVRAAGGNVTINPANNINGQGSIVVPAGYTAIIFCNGSEFFSMLVYQDVPTQAKAFPTGTRMVFQQTAAPTGWTKDSSAAYNDATFRATNGTVGTGGADAFSSVFGPGKTTGSHAITAAETGPHAHTITSYYNPGGSNSVSDNGGGFFEGGVGQSTSTAGGGAGHTHGLTMNIKYVDLIVASIN